MSLSRWWGFFKDGKDRHLFKALDYLRKLRKAVGSPCSILCGHKVYRKSGQACDIPVPALCLLGLLRRLLHSKETYIRRVPSQEETFEHVCTYNLSSDLSIQYRKIRSGTGVPCLFRNTGAGAICMLLTPPSISWHRSKGLVS